MKLDLAKSAALLEGCEDVWPIIATTTEAGDCAYLALRSFGGGGEGEDAGKCQSGDGREMHDDGG